MMVIVRSVVRLVIGRWSPRDWFCDRWSSVLTASVSLNEGFPHPPCFLVSFVVGSVVVPVWSQDCCPLVYNFLRIGGRPHVVTGYNSCGSYVSSGSTCLLYTSYFKYILIAQCL